MASVSNRVRVCRKAIYVATASFLFYFLAAAILTWPLLTNMKSDYFSAEVPGDGMSIIADNWYNDYAREQDLKEPVTDFYAYPFGFDLREIAKYPLDAGIRYRLTPLIGPQAAYNILILLSFPFAGLFMLLLVYYVTRNAPASFLGGFLYAFSPWHTARAFDQVSLTGIHTLPLFVLALIVFWRRRDLPASLGLAVASVVAFYTDFHFGLFCGLLAVTWVVTALLLGRKGLGSGRCMLTRRSVKVSTRKALLLALAVIIVVIAAVVPVLSSITYQDPRVFAEQKQSNAEEAVQFSANPWNYVVPPAHSLVWKRLVSGFVADHLGKRTSNEVTSYPSLAVIALAIMAIILVARMRRGKVGRGDSLAKPEDERQQLITVVSCFCALSAVSAFVLSLPPYYEIGTTRIPMPSTILGFIAPPLRYYCRWSIVVLFSLCLLAAIGFFVMSGAPRWNASARLLALILVLLVFVVDVTIVPPLRSRDIDRPPTVLEELALWPEDEPVAIYPLAQGLEYATFHYRYYQRFHLHPMMNGIMPATEGDLYRLSAKDIYAQYTPGMLKGLDIEKAVVLKDYFSNENYGNYPYGIAFEPDMMPEGYELASIADDGYIYDIVAEPATVYPLYYSGFTPPSILSDGRAWAVMDRPFAKMLLIDREPPSTCSLTVTVINPGPAGLLALTLDGEGTREYELNNGKQELTVENLELSGERQYLAFEWSGGPQAVEGRPFRVDGSLQVYLMMSSPGVVEPEVVPPGR